VDAEGRAGRVKSGHVYRLMSRSCYDRLDAQQVPEIRRVPLEQLCLQIKVLKLGNIKEFLSECMEAPLPTSIDSSTQLLLELGALKEAEDSATAKCEIL
jgi:HrpA-like RNA helicase